MTIRRIVSPSLSPNTEAEDVWEAIEVLGNPRAWQQGSAIDEVEKWFNGVSFDSGRSALLVLLQAFNIGQGDEVLMQAFTCVAVPNSVRCAGATPVYVDIDESYNIDPKDLEKKITKQSIAIIVQHSFGVPAEMDAILAIAKKHKLIVIEDCAHALGATYKGKKVGTLGDGAFFSFGRDKVVSSVWGGVATINAKCQVPNAKWKIKEIQNKLPYPSNAWIAQQLFHPIAFAVILPMYNVVIGKVLLEAFKRMKLLSVPNPPFLTPRRYPNALAQLLLKQLAKLERYNKKRRGIASYYQNELQNRALDKGAIYLRYPILVDEPAKVIQRAKKQGILLGNWYHNVIDPKGVDLNAIGYARGSCPRAEEQATQSINLPTRITEEEARRVVCILIG